MTEVDVRTAGGGAACRRRCARRRSLPRTARQIAEVHDHAIRHSAALQGKHIVIAAIFVRLRFYDDAHRARVELPQAHLRRKAALDFLVFHRVRRKTCSREIDDDAAGRRERHRAIVDFAVRIDDDAHLRLVRMDAHILDLGERSRLCRRKGSDASAESADEKNEKKQPTK